MLIRVRAAAVNPVDTQMRARENNRFAESDIAIGFDVSGVVVQTGPGVRGFGIGDEVFAMLDLRRGGGYAEYALVREGEAALKPDRLSHVDAAAVPLVTLTAWQALFDTADLQAGQTVLIHAGAGGVGSMAVQLAKWKGARVIATASDYNHDFLREIGADVVVDYRTQRFEDFAENVDVVLDPIGGETQSRSLDVLKDGGHLVTIFGGGMTEEAQNPPRDITAEFILVEPNAQELTEIGRLIDQGRLRPIVSHQMTLEEAAAAHEQSETHHTRGKIVLVVDGVVD